MGVKTGIERIDTNIILRIITRDNKEQFKKAVELLSDEERIFVFEPAAMMEVVFVLTGKIYGYSREKVAALIKAVIQFPTLCCNRSIIEGALDVYVSHPKLSFVDCYLAVMADTTAETPLWTFDHKLATQCPVAKELE